ncbi:MAG: PLP-dependent aminotransferase family protein [Dermatophilaceae bacterium]
MTRHLSTLIAEGRPGSALPSTRQLSRELSASPVTIGRAVAALAAAGLVHTEPGRGTFISTRPAHRSVDASWQPMALPPARVESHTVAPLDPAYTDDSLVALSSGYLGADLQPRQALQAAAARTIRRSDIWGPSPSTGLPGLRAAFAAEVGFDADDILITNGSQAGLALVLRTITTPGQAVVVENPTYAGALAAVRAAGLRPVPVPTDGDGVRPEDLDRIVARTDARVAYLQTAVSNPSGASLSRERRQTVLDVARKHQILVIDDDWARHLVLEPGMPPPLIVDDAHGHVIHISSLAKPVAPSLRIGYIAARGPALRRLHTATIADKLFVARPLQEVALEFLASPDWPRHTKRVGRTLAARRDHLLGELARLLAVVEGPIRRPRAGYHLWVPCLAGWTSTEVTQVAHAAGIIVGDGAHAYADEPPGHNVRMSFGAVNEATTTQAIERLAGALARVPGP